ncbi:MAG TPA: hypothetical protein VML19_19670 [Verrucomicrobiae bacterium]|nr:hypothetical protein [Verrucomicrobiae bacterium]
MKLLPFFALAILCCAGAAWTQSLVPLNTVPSRVVGHVTNEGNILSSYSPNLVVGREFWTPYGIAEDTSVSPPILYVSDTNNSRVLAWKNATAFNNGQPADLVIGQKDFNSTFGQGPGQTFASGLNQPAGIAVDAKGNLYVMDFGNNRILRYPKPFNQTPGSIFPDLYIGQPTLNSNAANYTGQVAAQGLALNTTSQAIGVHGNLAFDSSGNLWVTDIGNFRVLEFKASDLANGGGPLTATLEIGQLDFNSNARLTNSNSTAALTTNQLSYPTNVTFDSSGWLYISDFDNSGAIDRVLVFKPPFSSGQSAYRILGVFAQGSSPSTAQLAASRFLVPEGIFFLPGNSGVGLVDSVFNRILLFPPAASWADVTSGGAAPAASAIIGQTAIGSTNIYPNQATANNTFPAASRTSVAGPTGAYFSGTELFLVDSGNNRVVVLPYSSGCTPGTSGSCFGGATRVLGQDNFTSTAANLIEGKEFNFTNSPTGSASIGAGIVIDASSGTPHLYVSDSNNHRILGFKDARRLTAGAAADIVIGQPDLATSVCNYPTGNQNQPSQSSLCFPGGLAVDPSGNLYVADRGNSRVLRFPAPFAFQGQLEQADLVLGQTSFTVSGSPGPTPSTMSAPYGLAFSPACNPTATNCTINGLMVSDLVYNRVLYIPTSGGGFNAGTDNGKAATKVYGQPDFSTITPGNSTANLSSPRGLACDTFGRPYVADTANNRVLIFSDPNSPSTPATGAQATLPVTGFNAPAGVFVNATTGEIWVADFNNGRAIDYPQYDLLQFNAGSTTTIPAPNPIALTQDQYGNLLVADASNRIGLYFPGLQAVNGFSFIPSLALAPGMIASICSPGSACANGVAEFGSVTAANTSLPNPLPLPTTLGDTQVTFNGTAVPLYAVSPTQINFVVPMSAPTSNTADLEVTQASTGRLYASAQVPMNVASPGLIEVQTSGQTRQALIVNADGSINSPTSPAKRGSVITIYATGQGFIPNAPGSGGGPDGSLPQGLISTPVNPRVVMGFQILDEVTPQAGDPPNGQFVSFSGLAPWDPGVWQINVQIPMAIPPGAQTMIGLIMNGVASVTASTYITTFAVSQ